MPILDVEVVMEDDQEIAEDLASDLANAAGSMFKLSGGRVWVKVRKLSMKQYSENGGGPPFGVLPVFVSVLKAKIPESGDLEQEVSDLTDTVAKIFDRLRENIHIFYEPAARGRVAFGGRLIG